ncbi:MAG TPA: DUF3516 domain-containing protein, partial [Thermoanaerobaculia bacterium]|nr:DUF3516 domain-containing protein [Thermoanaerobaculia bacterium]
FGPEARRHAHTRIEKQGEGRWQVTQVLLDPEGDHLWHALGTVEIDETSEIDGPLVELLHLGT